MKALGTSNQRRLSISQREAVMDEFKHMYSKYVENAKDCAYLFTLICMCQVLEDDYDMPLEKVLEIKDKVRENVDEMNEWLLSNTYIDGKSKNIKYDAEFNQEKLKEFAKYFEIPFSDEIFKF